jgi:hypothetical protein
MKESEVNQKLFDFVQKETFDIAKEKEASKHKKRKASYSFWDKVLGKTLGYTIVYDKKLGRLVMEPEDM